ncbi:MAG: TolC family protein [Verrucomicrobiae bacterium]|nr:TolC family protein [Verrucomicrobiae bacterium]
MLAGCAVGPEFLSPDMTVPSRWEHAPKTEQEIADLPLPENTQAWWDEFCDQDMKRLIARLIEANPDLHRARARIDEALAQRKTHVAGRIPHADLTAWRDDGFAEFGSGKIKRSDPKSRSEFWQIDAGWELDLFGEHSRAIEASTAEASHKVESWRDVLVFLIGEVGIYYTEMRVNEERAAMASEFVNAYQETVRVSQEREERGAASILEVEEATARLLRQQANIPEYERLASQARHQLARLLACSSQELSQLITPDIRTPIPPLNIYAGIPADVVQARPDIRAAEDRIEAQVARLGLATTQLYPNLHLSGAITYEMITRGTTVDLLRQTIGGGTTFAKRLFHAGADRARVAEQEAYLQQDIRSYEATVLTAINEVEDALSDLHYGRLRKQLLDEAARASSSASSRIREAYSFGLVDVGSLLRALEEDFQIQTEHLFARNLLAKGSVRLYKATGGGQLPLPPDETPENLIATRNKGLLRPLSVLFSLGSDRNYTLHSRNLIAKKDKEVAPAGTGTSTPVKPSQAPVSPFDSNTPFSQKPNPADRFNRAFTRSSEG